MPKELNPLLHSQLRLGVMSILMVKEEADFVYLKEKTESLAASLPKGRLLSKSMSIR